MEIKIRLRPLKEDVYYFSDVRTLYKSDNWKKKRRKTIWLHITVAVQFLFRLSSVQSIYE